MIAVGALTAGNEILSDLSTTQIEELRADLMKRTTADVSTPNSCSHLPLELARSFFTQAKVQLGDFLETCSLESQQTLFLMSIFCQHALKLHGCYMYNGLAVRTAMAIGSSNLLDIRKNPIEAIRTWWSMYYHEAEICCLLGRETILRDPDHYPVFLAKFGDPFPEHVGSEKDETLFFGRSLTELARILQQIYDDLYDVRYNPGPSSVATRHQASLELDKRLLGWRDNLKPMFDLDGASLIEPESVTKRKMILRLRKCAEPIFTS